jgi:hypothetical protein
MKVTEVLVPVVAIFVMFSGGACARSQTYDFITIAGNAGYGSSDGTNSAVRFGGNPAFSLYGPQGIAVDGGGNLYVADSGNNTIRKLMPVGTNWVSSTIGGLAGSQGGTDATNNDSRFAYAKGVAVDSGGKVYVADSGNNTIRKLSKVGTNWVSSTIAGLTGTPGSADGTNSLARFNLRRSVAVDGAGNVYVADTDNLTIRKLKQVGTNWVSSTIAGLAGSQGSADGTNSDSRFYSPRAVALDSSGNVYVADNFTIRKLMPVGTDWVSSTIGGLAGSPGSDDGAAGAARFFNPVGVAVDRSGNVYVADNGNNTIRQGVPQAVELSILQAILHNNLITLTWSATPGLAYQLQYSYSSDLTSANWNSFGNTITATNATMSASDALASDKQRFYRVVLLAQPAN